MVLRTFHNIMLVNFISEIVRANQQVYNDTAMFYRIFSAPGVGKLLMLEMLFYGMRFW